MSAAALAAGYAADGLIGDPRRGHPVAGFGRVAIAVERAAYAPSRARGAACALALVAGAGVLAEALARLTRRAGLGRDVAFAAVVWAALGGRSLGAEGRAIARLLRAEDLAGARARLPTLCGRDADGLDRDEVSRAVVESVAENTADAVVGALLWGVAAGPAGVAAYRAANTLDAMWGHRSDRYEQFGWAAARLDDAMGWPGARVGAALAVAGAPLVGGSPAAALRAVRHDAAAHPSPNAGVVEAAFAGALGLRLGGDVAYGGRVEHRATLGDGRGPAVEDVGRAVRLSAVVGAASAALAVACAAARSRRSARARRRA